mgnify:CR=1 FL=1
MNSRGSPENYQKHVKIYKRRFRRTVEKFSSNNSGGSKSSEKLKNIITFILPDGEQEKTLKNVHKVIHQMLEAGFGRDATLISLGGGVICDMGGFAASIFMRGINLIQAGIIKNYCTEKY